MISKLFSLDYANKIYYFNFNNGRYQMYASGNPLDIIAHTTVRIECITNSGVSTGTGFFFQFLEDKEKGSQVPCIVTNKHVIEGAKVGKLYFSPEKTKGIRDLDNHYIFEVADFENKFILHPDPNVDLAIFPLAEVINQLKKEQKSFYYVFLNKSNVISESYLQKIPTINDILMIGYPNGIWDTHHNLPIIRKGITATHPKLSYCGKNEFMIDAACFPGSSGSPVFLSYIGSYIDPESQALVAGTKILLLGVLYAGPQHTTTGEIKIINVPTVDKPFAISSIPNNLGLVIQIQKVLDFEDILSSLINAKPI
ncbi:serine protease [Acinetobacter baumannii]|nr:serine protease [Acinetobacter baumannii]